jgi:hypothetical protein
LGRRGRGWAHSVDVGSFFRPILRVTRRERKKEDEYDVRG